MTWVYWEQLLAEFGINLNRFGGRASASLGNDARILIRLTAGQWQIEQTSPTGWKIVVRDFGLNRCGRIWPSTTPNLLAGG